MSFVFARPAPARGRAARERERKRRARMRAGPSNETGSSTKATEMTALADAFRDTFAVEYVTAREVMDRRAREVGSRPMVLVDVRGEEERAVSVIEGAVSAETYESTRSTLGPHDCVCYCTIGYRSGQYAEKMAKAAAGGTDDARYFNLYGSILAWTHAGGACVVPATGERTTRVHTFGKQWSCVADGYEVYFKRPLAKGFGQMVRGWFGRKK